MLLVSMRKHGGFRIEKKKFRFQKRIFPEKKFECGETVAVSPQREIPFFSSKSGVLGGAFSVVENEDAINPSLSQGKNSSSLCGCVSSAKSGGFSSGKNPLCKMHKNFKSLKTTKYYHCEIIRSLFKLRIHSNFHWRERACRYSKSQ